MSQVKEKNFYVSIATLCFCGLCHAYLLISVFPYSGFMAIQLIPKLNHENAGSYAGVISSSFMAGRAISSYAWGKISDRIGRKPVISISLLLSLFFTLLFGLSQSFFFALSTRFLLGLSNGIISTSKTLVSELARGDKEKEIKGMGMVLGMWGWGFLICPAVSGALAEPVSQYPNSYLVQKFEAVLSRYPFLLPNLLGSVMCTLAYAGVLFFVEETLQVPSSGMRIKDIVQNAIRWFHITMLRFGTTSQNSQETLPLNCTPNHVPIKSSSTDESMEILKMRNSESTSYLSLSYPVSSCETESDPQSENDINDNISENDAVLPPPSISTIWAMKSTRQHLISYWLYSFVSSFINEVFPLFCLAKKAGLGLPEAHIGIILSGSGVIFAICQYFVYSFMVNKFGLYRSMFYALLLSTPVTVLIPVSIVVNREAPQGEVSHFTFFFLSFVLAMYRVFSMVFFSSITIATNQTVPTSYRGTMNGLSMLGGSICKALGPTIAGLLFAFCVSSGVFSPQTGSYMVFLVISLMGLFVAFGTTLEEKIEVASKSDDFEMTLEVKEVIHDQKNSVDKVIS